MKNNKLPIALLFALVLLLVPSLAACGYDSVSADGVKHIPHDVDLKFENCFVCHTGGLVPAGGEALGEVHKSYPLALCSSPACHPSEPVAPKPTTQPTTEPTTKPTSGPTTDPTTGPTTEPTTKPSGEPTAENAPDISHHPSGTGYDGLCWVCHMIGGTDPMPDDGYHEDYEMDTCYDCHVVAFEG